MRIGRNSRKLKVLAGLLGLGMILFGLISCNGEKEASSGSLGLQIVFPDSVGPSGKGANQFSKIEDWSVIHHLSISSYVIVDNDYFEPFEVGHTHIYSPGNDPYVDLEVFIFSPLKVYFVVHAYYGMGMDQIEIYRGYAIEMIDPGADNTVIIMMMPDSDLDGYFPLHPSLNFLDPFFTVGVGSSPDCNDTNGLVYPWYTEQGACSDGLDNDCDGLIDSQDPDCPLQTGMEFVYIAPGTFMMGSYIEELGRRNNEDYHEVTLTSGFEMQTTEVTQKQWADVITEAEVKGILEPGELNKNPSYPPHGDNIPVVSITWARVQTFISALNALSEINGEYYYYRLPTEAEWEYAARAGSETAFADEIDSTVYDQGEPPDCLEEPGLDAIAWYCFNYNADIGTREVGMKAPNAWGLHDMHGSVSEWCQDWYVLNLGFEPVINPSGPPEGTLKAVRGGHRGDRSWDVRAAVREAYSDAYTAGSALGFRLVRED